MICYAVNHNQSKLTGGNSGSRPFCIATPVSPFIGDNDMKEILLANGKGVALVDDADYERLNQYKWYVKKCDSTMYARRNSKSPSGENKQTYMHHDVIGYDGNGERDHINHNGLDNRRSNLRVCTRSQNAQNRKLYGRNTSGYKGVSWDRPMKRWRASIKLNGNTRHIGYYFCIVKAAKAYDEKARELFGEFANTNFNQP